jgi:hypothetical protein
MAEITVAGDMLEVQVTGWDRIWALSGMWSATGGISASTMLGTDWS